MAGCGRLKWGWGILEGQQERWRLEWRGSPWGWVWMRPSQRRVGQGGDGTFETVWQDSVGEMALSEMAQGGRQPRGR